MAAETKHGNIFKQSKLQEMFVGGQQHNRYTFFQNVPPKLVLK